ncbi:hypothetical protein BH09BAC6_BH09BAC6_23100 [soil metagenome]|jgi:gliding motility-associated-like protein
MNRYLLIISITTFFLFISSNTYAQSDQSVVSGDNTAAVNFAGSQCLYKWVNNTPGIGLPASGTGNIPSFAAINNSNKSIIATITATPVLQGFAYIANTYGNTVSVINTSTNSVVSTIPVGLEPVGVTVSPDGTRVYTANTYAGTVSVINTVTNSVIATVPLGSYPFGILASPDGTRVYVANFNDGTLSIINAASNKVTSVISVGAHAQCIASNADGSRLYVTNYVDHVVYIIDTSTYRVVNTVYIGIEPWALWVTPDGSRVYVGSSNSSIVSVINTSNNSVSTISTGVHPQGIMASPDGKWVYAANSGDNSVSVISVATNTVIATVPVGMGPLGLSTSPDGSRLYVANFASDNVSVINTSTNMVIATIGVGSLPNTIGNFVTGSTGCSPVKFTITVNPNTSPAINSTGSLSALTGIYGTASVTNSFTLSGSNLAAGILVTPPPGFEVSTDNVHFSKAVTMEAAGTIGSAPVYIRIASTTAAGNYSGNVLLSSQGAGNINIPIPVSIVNPAPLTITANNESKPYGTALKIGSASIPYIITGLQNSETIANIVLTYGTGSAANAPAGIYSQSVIASSPAGGTFNAGNYSITYVTGDIIVSKVPLTITADNKAKTFGSVIPSLTISYSGFVNNENFSQLTVPPQITTTANATSLPGQYPIAVAGAVAGNYTIIYVPGILTITPANPLIVIPNAFTPNGDGINDVWNIKSLSDYSQCNVFVYNRYGSLIYQSTGYSRPWDGLFNGTPVPVGTYYYIINLQNRTPELTGQVSIIR